MRKLEQAQCTVTFYFDETCGLNQAIENGEVKSIDEAKDWLKDWVLEDIRQSLDEFGIDDSQFKFLLG
jgi:hypothetical protein